MNEKNEQSQSKLRIFVVIIVLIIVLIGLVISALQNYVKESIHKERTIYLTAQTDTTATVVNQEIDRFLDYSRTCKNVIPSALKDGDNITEFMNDIQSVLSMSDARLILVDDKSTWYGEDGTTGRISATTYYGSRTDDELVYMTQGVDVNIESMCFRQRLDKPITVVTETGRAEICYCCVIYYMDKLANELSMAFPYECNSFIVDSDGLMIYKNFATGVLVSGTNLFAKYARVDFSYGDTAEEQLDRIRNKEIVVGEFDTDSGDSHFICVAPLDVNDWYVSFMVAADQLAAGSYISRLTMFMIGLGLLFAAMIIFVIVMIITYRNSREMLKAEKKISVELDKASRAKGDFISNMSHDIRTPINGIMGMTAIAAKEDNPAKTKECLDKIDISSKYLLSLVNDVLDMSAIESGKIVISKAPVNIRKLMDDCMVIAGGMVKDKTLELITDYDSLVHTNVMLDEIHFRQVVINILSNAIKFTPDKGHVILRAVEKGINRKTGEVNLKFEIADNGVGMSAEFVEHLWDRFSQESNKARSQFKGSGLGMAIAKSLVDAMGGTIKVNSKKDKGTTFTIELPLEVCEDGITSGSDDLADEKNKRLLDGVKILIAEDNEINMEIAKDILESEGAIVTATTNGKEMTDIYESSEDKAYNVILMDVMMPVMNGLEATRLIRASAKPDARTIPIIAMTANTQESDIKNAEDAGMNDYITKPLGKDKVISAVLKRIVRTGLMVMALAALVVFPLGGCAAKDNVKEETETEISMYVGLGNTSGDYYPNLHEKILEGTGIDVKFIYSNAMDTTNAMVNMMDNEDLPADIIITSSRATDEIQKKALLDMAAYTNIPDKFSSVRMRECSVDGAIYQIPFSTRLIGVEYNKTLLEEHGWKLPKNFKEMVELKKKADKAGVEFAISGGAATGHGFNYIFHLMGSQYLSSADGTQWIEEFLKGETDVSEFAAEAEYFKKYAEAGLFGKIHDEDWNASTEFLEKRALFYYNIINDVYESEGGDEYATMPWLSENGMSSCFTAYDNVFIALDKHLAEDEDRLAMAIRVLDFMTEEEVSRLFLDTTPDGYISTNDFTINESRMYYDCAEGVEKGYLQPWYYNYFDVDSIVNVGQVVNDYLKGTEGVEFDDIIDTLATENEKYLAGDIDMSGYADAYFDYEDVAKLEAVIGGKAMQQAVDEAGVNAKIQLAMIPYTDSLENLPLYTHIGVVQNRIYEGYIETSKIRTYLTDNYNSIQLINMSGADIKELVKNGYNTLEDFDYDHSYRYACMFEESGGKVENLDDGTTYLVAIPPKSLETSRYEAYVSEGAVITDLAGNPVTTTIEDGFAQYFENFKHISPDSISWD